MTITKALVVPSTRRSPRLLLSAISSEKTTSDSSKTQNLDGENVWGNTRMVQMKNNPKKVDKALHERIKRNARSNKIGENRRLVAKGERIGISEFFLPRHHELRIIGNNTEVQVIGVDEAGRGPLAGPVVTAAIIVPYNIDGVTDSKKITCERSREQLYEKIISSPNVQWAIAIVDSRRIDEINILQATLEGMRNAINALTSSPLDDNWNIETDVSPERRNCYVVLYRRESHEPVSKPHLYHALIDGNRLPSNLPCKAEAIIKGDACEYSIAAASILAKVTRDRIMNEYDKQFPQYGFSQHKGYPTAAHMKKVYELGASPVHRRSFAPLKTMTFDQNGHILQHSDNNTELG